MTTFTRPMIACALALAVGPAATVAAQAAQPMHATKPAIRAAHHTKGDTVYRPRLARQFLDEVAAADRALQRDERKAALDTLDDAAGVLRTITGSTGSHFAVVGSISNLYEEVDEVPTPHAKGSAQTLTPVVTKDERIVMRVRLDLNQARTNLEQARAALTAGNTEKAGSLMRAIREGLVVDEHHVAQPLAAAGANFELAWIDTLEGNWAGAQRAFDQAVSQAKQSQPTAAPHASEHASAHATHHRELNAKTIATGR